MNDHVFRKYDIRGVFPDDLDEALVHRLGLVLGNRAKGSIAVGRDCRNSGDTLLQWLCSGILAGGSDVLDLGVITTPMAYFAAHSLEPDITVMITGSHNPAEYNGFKIMYGLRTIFGQDIQDIRKSMHSQLSETGSGLIQRISVARSYDQRLRREFCFDRSLKVVVDAGNGTGGETAIPVLRKLGCRTVPLYCDMDGNFPNHHPDPTVEENLVDLKRMVIDEKADLGIAFDGDADRLGVVDENGDIIWGDRLLIILSRDLLSRYPGATILSEVKASSLFFSEISRLGGRALMSPTGHSLIKKMMLEEDALLAGEMSGHIFFRDRYFGYDDALYATLRLIEILSRNTLPLSSYLSQLPEVFSTPEIREDCPDSVKFQVVDTVTRMLENDGYSVDTTDGARVEFPTGWGLIRASNTQPVLVLRFEAGTQHQLIDYENLIRTYIRKAGKESHVQTAD